MMLPRCRRGARRSGRMPWGTLRDQTGRRWRWYRRLL